MRKPTPSQIKSTIENCQGERHPNSYFFSRSTMAYFGDTMKSFATLRDGEQVYLYRKPTAYITTFTGERKPAGMDFAYFYAWDGYRLDRVDDENELSRLQAMI